MALKSSSLFNYGFQITANNQNLQFQAVSGGPVLLAKLSLGFYSMTSLLAEVVRRMQLADPVNVYTATVDRTVSGGTQNRVSISTSGSFLSFPFLSGSLSVSSPAALLGFNVADYSGSTSYQGAQSAGTPLVTTFPGFNYQPPELYEKVYGASNVSASGLKEAIVFGVQEFIEVEFRYEPSTQAFNAWNPLLAWMMKQRLFEFTPEIASPSKFYQATLEISQVDGKGLGFKMKEMLPMIDLYGTGPMTFRVSA